MKKKIRFNLNILIIFGLSIFIGFIAYLLFSAGKIETESIKKERKVEINNTVLRGYKNGKLLWSMQSVYVWSAMSIDHAIAEYIYNGRFYDNDKLLLDNLNARRVQVNAPQERFYADKGFRAIMYRGYDTTKPVDIWGEQLNYSAAGKKSQLNKSIHLTDRDTSIVAESASIDHSNNQISFGSDAVLSRPDSTLTANAILIDINSNLFHANKNVHLVRQPENTDDEFKKQPTDIFTDNLEADVSTDLARLTMSGNILIQQPDKQAMGDTARFDETDGLFHLYENAVVIFDKTEVLLDVETRQKIKDKELLQEKMQMQADQIIIDTNTKDLQASGNVQVAVKNKEATAKQAKYLRQEEKIYLYDDVSLKQDDGSLVNAQEVVVDIATETFTAVGQAESTFYLNR